MMSVYQNEFTRYSYRKCRPKTDWAGITIGDAFKHNIDYYLRLQAQQEFYRLVKKVQITLAKYTGSVAPEQPKAKPQLSPFYANYPSILSAYAAIGLTGYLEFEARLKEKILLTHLATYLKNPAQYDRVKALPQVYQKLAMIVAKNVQARLLLEDLSRLPFASSVELYRLFSASQQTMGFHSVPEIIKTVVLYGDILPAWQEQDLHPMTRSILKDITKICAPFFDKLPNIVSHRMVGFGAEWVRALCLCLVKYLPEQKIENRLKPFPESKLPDFLRREILKDSEYKFKEQPKPPLPKDEITPLKELRAPSLFDPVSPGDRITRSILNNNNKVCDEKKPVTSLNPTSAGFNKEAIMNFIKAVENAGRQQRNWEDMRSDLLEKALRVSDFAEGPIQGNPADGHEVITKLNGGKTCIGEIFDRAMGLSDDYLAYEKLLEESKSITDALRRTLYPNREQVPETEHFCSSGSLDPSRLAMADVSPAVFRRYRINEKANKRGSPLLLIACDGSGSLKENQIKILKMLTAAWLNSTVKSSVQVLAGLYHSGQIRHGLSGPLIQWIYHPQKTPATSRKEAARALISLPKAGTGAQSDALSLSFMLDEARRLARGRMTYLIMITDCKWNKSFPTSKSGGEEVYFYFQKSYRDFPGQLHTTLVALGVLSKTGLEDIVDKVINVSPSQLSDYGLVAEKIGVYVASCMRERHNWIAKQ